MGAQTKIDQSERLTPEQLEAAFDVLGIPKPEPRKTTDWFAVGRGEFDATTLKRSMEQGVNSLRLGHATTLLLKLSDQEAVQEVADQKRKAVEELLQEKGYWLPGFHELQSWAVANGIVTEFEALGAGMVGDTGVVFLRSHEIKLGEVNIITDPVSGEPMQRFTDHYLGFSADATTAEMLNEGTRFGVKGVAVDRAAQLVVAAANQGHIILQGSDAW